MWCAGWGMRRWSQSPSGLVGAFLVFHTTAHVENGNVLYSTLGSTDESSPRKREADQRFWTLQETRNQCHLRANTLLGKCFRDHPSLVSVQHCMLSAMPDTGFMFSTLKKRKANIRILLGHFPALRKEGHRRVSPFP